VTLEKEFTIRNWKGLHMKAASMFVRTANQFDAEIHVQKDAARVNGKSILGLMGLAAGKGSTVVVSTSGRDADAALAALGKLIDAKFGEE
jgi:phosphocarrier protein